MAPGPKNIMEKIGFELPDIFAFTVTKPIFERLCTLDENSFLYKPFWRNLREARDHAGH